MSTKKGQAVSEEDLEKASGGRVEERKLEDGNTVYDVFDDKTAKLIGTFNNKEEAYLNEEKQLRDNLIELHKYKRMNDSYVQFE